ncbi:hypothetical protein GLW08_18320 [Pontibacillus yanchengensis]|uniref:Uncharacterized protein n=2 Tax=Pontibacillus yanchengensis TaxID=462910 RepID=A0A6I5A1W1_9BACI|nr:hypothetical protein [Pontibacillus yanchengensis]MYL35007.1 hypothetical protein [Pontibacillus yanchengensis]MYL55281.1 hypothetical protein [Pontibacillus yanchengensis]
MKIDDRLKYLRKSMTNTTLKNVRADKQELKQKVLNEAEKRKTPFFPWNPRSFIQGAVSIVGVGVLCIFIVYFGLSRNGFWLNEANNPNIEEGTQASVEELNEQLTERSLADKEGAYNIIIVHDGKKNTEAAQKWDVVKNDIFLLEQKQKVDRVDYVVTREYWEAFQLEQFPVALVFNTEELVYETTKPDELIQYINNSAP